MWNNLSIGEKIIWTVIGLNVGVFLLWRVPALQNFMVRNFSSSPFIGKYIIYYNRYTREENDVLINES